MGIPRHTWFRLLAITTFLPIVALTLVHCGDDGGGVGGVGGVGDNGSIADTAAPTAPADLTATAVSTNQINITWTGATDNVGVTGYEVWRGSAKLATVTRLSYNDTGLAASTSYSYTVKAFDAAGNVSAASNTASATTLASGTTGGEQDAPDMSSVPVSMTHDERKAALDTVTVFRKANTTTDLDADNFALANFIRTQPAFADAGVSPDQTVWARFKDGRPVVWFTERRVGNTAAPALSPSPGTSAPRAAPASAPRPLSWEIPQGSKAVMIDMEGVGGGGPSLVNGWLNMDGTGYSSVLLGGSLEDLETKIKDVAVLYFSTHGGFGRGQDGKRTYLLATSTIDLSPPDTTESIRRERMYYQGYLCYFISYKSDGTMIHYWAITEKFVQENWTFTPDSLIVIDGCSLFFDFPSNPNFALTGSSFRSTLAGKSDNKTTVVGWDGASWSTTGSDVIKLFFDRVLGANDYKPREIPPQRPFDYTQVHNWMKKNRKDTDASFPHAKLMIEERGTTWGQLVPSIRYAIVNHPGLGSGSDYAGEWILELSGTFGPKPQASVEGTVTVGNTSLAILDWTDGGIVAKLPASMASPGSFGDTVVEVRGHKSNAVPLTRWTGTVTQVRTGMISGGGRVEFSCPVRATADVHFWRGTDPGEKPQTAKFMNVEVPAACDYTFSGAWSVGRTDYVLSGSGIYPPIFDAGDDDIAGTLFDLALASVFPLDFKTSFFPRISPTGTLRTTIHSADGSVSVYTSTRLVMWSIANPLNTNPVSLDADYNLKGTVNCMEPLNYSSPETCTETWDLKPVGLTAPTPDTQR